MKSLDLRALPEVTLSERSDGSGTISFGSAIPWPARTANYSAGMGSPALPCIEAIRNARAVYDEVRRAQAEAR